MEENITKIFAKNLNKLMTDRHENLTQLSDRIDVAYSTVSDWQHGRKMPRSGSLQKLANHFGVMSVQLAMSTNIVGITQLDTGSRQLIVS